MADSGRERIVQDFVATVAAMGQGAGFHYDYGAPHRWRISAPEGPYPVPIVIDEDEEILGEPSGVIIRRLRVLLAAWHAVEFSEADAPARAATWMIHDLEAAAMADRTRSGLALDTVLEGSAADVGEAISPNVLVSVRVLVTYRTTPTDPTDVT